jgi:hypothetical protein
VSFRVAKRAGSCLREHLDPGHPLHFYIDVRDEYKPFPYRLPHRPVYLQPDQDLEAPSGSPQVGPFMMAPCGIDKGVTQCDIRICAASWRLS